MPKIWPEIHESRLEIPETRLEFPKIRPKTRRILKTLQILKIPEIWQKFLEIPETWPDNPIILKVYKPKKSNWPLVLS